MRPRRFEACAGCGVAKTAVGAKLVPAWETKLVGRLTAPVVAESATSLLSPEVSSSAPLAKTVAPSCDSASAGGFTTTTRSPWRCVMRFAFRGLVCS